MLSNLFIYLFIYLLIYLYIYLLYNLTHGTTKLKNKCTIKLLRMQRNLTY